MKFDRFGNVCRQLPNVREYPAAFAVRETHDLLRPFAQRRLGSFRLHQNALKFFLIRQRVDQDAAVAKQSGEIQLFAIRDLQSPRQILADLRRSRRVPPESGLRHTVWRAGKERGKAAGADDIPYPLDP